MSLETQSVIVQSYELIRSAEPAISQVVKQPVAPKQDLPRHVEVESKPYSEEIAFLTLRAKRPWQPIIDRSRVAGNAILERVYASARQVPELEALAMLQGKRATMDTDIERLSLDVAQLDLDRKRAVADLPGSELAAKLAEIDGDKRSLAEQIATLKAGRESFGAEVEAGKSSARRAVQSHIDAAMGAVMVELRDMLSTALDNIEQSVPLLELLDEAAVAHRVGVLVRSTPHDIAINKMLKDAVTGTAVKA